MERFDLQQASRIPDEQDTLIAARLEALNLHARPNLPVASPCKHEPISPSDVFVTASPTPARPPPVPLVETQETNGDLVDGTPVDEVDYIPVHLRWAGGRRTRASYAVPRDIRANYPPDNNDRQGWKQQRYYVVIRGYEVGIFYDFW